MQARWNSRRIPKDVVLERGRQGLTEFGLVAMLFLMYFATRGIAAGKEAVAFANAHTVMSLERQLGLYLELPLQALVLSEPWAIRLLNFVYAYTHMTGLIAFGIWAFIFHSQRYRDIRNTFLLILLTGLTIYILYPLAPPRFFPYTGFVDTLALHGGLNYDQPSLQMLYNPFAAMPSLHVGFSVFVGMGLIRLGRKLRHWILGITYPLMMTAAVIGTGNHFIVDAIAGCLLTIGAYYAVPRIGAFFASSGKRQQAEMIPS